MRRYRAIGLLAVLVMGLAGPHRSDAQTWTLNANGNWGTAANWSPASVPNSTGATVTFGNAITAARTVTLNLPVRLGTLNLGGNFAYTISGTNTLSFDVASGNAALTVTGTANHVIQAPIALSDTLTINRTSTGTLTFSRGISGAGALRIDGGSSTISLTTTANSFTGGTFINSGTVSYAIGGALPGGSVVNLGDNSGAADSARLNIDISMSTSAQALALVMGSDGLLVQGNNRLTRLASVEGTGELRVNAAVGNGFEFLGVSNASFSGEVTGGIALNSSNPNSGSRILKYGAATQALLGNNSAYVGRIFVRDGAITVGGATGLGTTSAGFSNATFVYNTGTIELAGGFSIAERFYLNGAGNGGAGALRSVSGNNTITGGVTLGWSNGLITATDAAIGVDAGSTLTVTGTIDGARRLTKVGGGTLVLNSAAAWTGGTTFAAGTLRQGSATAVPAGALTFAGGTFDLNGFSRTIPNLSGTGALALGSAAVTVNQSTAGTFVGTISGTGSLTKTGAATLTLRGTNTYSGGTTVTAGTLRGDSLSLQGAITNNASVIFDQITDGTYAGIMSGVGSLTKTGAGLLALTGANTYSGSTLISAGTLLVSAASLPGNVLNNAALVFDQSVTGIFSGAISGAGSLTKTGAGTLVLNGSNSYTGGTTILAGTLVASAATLPGDVVNGGALVFNQAASGTVAGAISGPGSLTKTGAGTLTLTGANSYTGGTTISAGTLRGTTDSLRGPVLNNAVMVFDQAIAGAFIGSISGAGSLTKSGAGEVTLIGTNSYSGGTTVTAGTLRGDSLSLQGAITNNAAVIFDQASTGTYAGAMSGTGNLLKTGAGTLFLTGTSNVAGGTTVAQGTLSVDGTLGGPLIVENGATLAGRGTAGAVQVLPGGIISPGNSIGTLSLGSLDQSGIYLVEYRAPSGGLAFVASGAGQSVRGRNSLLDPALPLSDQDADLISISGAAALAAGSSVALQRQGDDASFLAALGAAGNTNRELRYLILRADGGVTGRYVALSESGSTLEYLDANGAPGEEDIWLVIRGTDTPVITGSAPAPYSLPFQGQRPRCDLEALAPDQLRCAFVQGDLSRFDLDPAGDTQGTDTDAGGGVIGIGAQVATGLWLGLALGYETGDASLSDGSGSADVDQTAGTLWANWQTGDVELRGWLGFGGYDLNSSRQTATGARAEASYGASRVSLAVEMRRWFDMGQGAAVSPLIGLSAARFETDGYAETGAGIENFRADQQSQYSLRSLLGVEGQWLVQNTTTPVRLSASAGWSYEFGDTEAELSGTYEGDATATTLTSTGTSASRNELVATLGATFAVDDSSSLRLEYGLGYSDDALDQSAIARWSMAF